LTDLVRPAILRVRNERTEGDVKVETVDGYEFARMRDGTHRLVAPRNGWPKGLRDFDLTLDWIKLGWNSQVAYGDWVVKKVDQGFLTRKEVNKASHVVGEAVLFSDPMDALRYGKNQNEVQK
jgi:hypothetical protein